MARSAAAVKAKAVTAPATATKKQKPQTKIEYKAAHGSRLTDHDAEVIAKFLNRLYPQGATPEEVLEAALRNDAPDELKKKFEWNDHKAAKNYRIEQARHILRAINVIITTDGEEVETRAFHSIFPQGEPDRRYVPMQIVFSRPDYTAQVVENARQEMESWIGRYESYKKLSKAVSHARGVLSRIP